MPLKTHSVVPLAGDNRAAISQDGRTARPACEPEHIAFGEAPENLGEVHDPKPSP
jgi:hypothetical protein